MNNRKLILKLVGTTIILNSSLTMADDVPSEVARQVTRQISQSISKRVSATEDIDASKTDQNPTNSLWLNPQYTDIATSGNSGGTNVNSSVNLYSMTFGGDKNIGNLTFGAAGNYTQGQAKTQIGGLNIPGFTASTAYSNSNSWSISPYAAYKFNKNVFLNGIIGYANYQDMGSINVGSLISDFSLNGVLPIDKLALTGKVGYRGQFSEFSGAPTVPGANTSVTGINGSFYTQTVYISGEVSYKINNFRPYFNSSWEHIIPDSQTGAGTSSPSDIDQVYSTLGLDYSVQKALTVGVYYVRELTQNTGSSMLTNNYNATGANVKFKF